MEVPYVPRQPTAEKRQRRERGSINPDDIINGAFKLAEQVGIDNLSMPVLLVKSLKVTSSESEHHVCERIA